jgi:acyl dehydratase
VRYFEDFREGESVDLGSITVGEQEIVEFASRYDPQPFHVDPAAASETPFGGLIASGWHTAALYMSLFVRGLLLDAASLGSPGVEDLRWRAPVRPGDTLHGRATIVSTRPSQTNPGRGTVIAEHEVRNQDGTVVMTMRARGFFAKRS